jgi:hypothetical protein
MAITLETYRQAERAMAAQEATTGLRVHAAICGVVCVGLVLLNVLVASEFPWAIFPVLGMSIGLSAHWWFGVRHLDETMVRHQDEVERAAERMGRAA